MTAPCRLAPLAITLAAAACGGEPGTSAGHHVTRDSAGIRIVESRQPQWRAVRIEPQPLLTIGAEEDGPYQFSFVTQALLLDGALAVVDARAAEIRVFDTAGAHLRSVGRSGSGPGEFRGIAALFRYGRDSLVAFDQQLRRSTVISTATGGVRTRQLEEPGNQLAFGVLPDGRLLLFNPGRGFRPDLPPGLQWDTTAVIAASLGDGASATLTRLPGRQQHIEPDGNTRSLVPAHGSIQAAAASGFYWATSDNWEIRFFDGDGVLRRIQRRDVAPQAVDASLIRQWVDANLERVRRFEGEAAVPRYRQMYEQGEYGAQVPFFESAFVDADGRLWVAEATWPALNAAPRRWSVFSPDGVWLGDVDAADRLRILDSRGDLVLGVRLDELDVPHVQLHRLIVQE